MHNEDLLIIIATGLRRIADDETGKIKQLPSYSTLLQKALNAVSYKCFSTNVEMPQSIPGLISWCALPFKDWPLDLNTGEASAGTFIEKDGELTELCYEFSYRNQLNDIEGDLFEKRFVHDLMSYCRNESKPDAYVWFRKFIIVTLIYPNFHSGLFYLRREAEDKFGPNLGSKLAGLIEEAYVEVPCGSSRETIFCCPNCGNPDVEINNLHKLLYCTNRRCKPFKLKSAVQINNHAKNPCYKLKPPLKKWIAFPGKAEIQLYEDLIQKGIKTKLWPDFDKYDLLLNFADGVSWVVDVKDWKHPGQLAKFINKSGAIERNEEDSWDRAFYVFPDYLCIDGYVKRFNQTCDLPSFCEGLSMRDFLKKVEEER